LLGGGVDREGGEDPGGSAEEPSSVVQGRVMRAGRPRTAEGQGRRGDRGAWGWGVFVFFLVGLVGGFCDLRPVSESIIETLLGVSG